MFDFDMLGLDPALNKTLEARGFSEPTPIQNQAIPLALDGHDVLGLAQTGTGKTLAFGLPLIHHLLNQPGKPDPKTAKALVLAPTRELVNQIAASLRDLCEGTKLKVATVVGGQPIFRQIKALGRGTDILVATPGRLIDLMERRAVDLSQTRQLVLDEADQMLDLGFIHALRQIEPKLGSPRQTMLFSATMPKQMEELSAAYLTEPKRVQVAPPGKAADKITQSVHFVPKPAKPSKLREILRQDPGALTLVFARTKHGAEKLMKGLVKDGFNAASIHGNKSQGQRDRAIKAFRSGEVTVLVATDVAARGIDIPGVSYVINYELPEVPDNYVHRIGRTARAGREGEAIALCAPEEVELFAAIEKLMKVEIPTGGGERPEFAAPGGGNRRKGNQRRRGRRPGGAPKGAPKVAADGNLSEAPAKQRRHGGGSKGGPKVAADGNGSDASGKQRRHGAPKHRHAGAEDGAGSDRPAQQHRRGGGSKGAPKVAADATGAEAPVKRRRPGGGPKGGPKGGNGAPGSYNGKRRKPRRHKAA